MAKYEKGSFIVVPNMSHLSGIAPIAQALYLWLCCHANQEGECYPSRTTLARECGIKKLHTLDRYMEFLISVGLVVKEERFKDKEQLSNGYFLPILDEGVAPKKVLGVAPKTARGGSQNGIGGSPQNGIQNSIHITQSNNSSSEEKSSRDIPSKPLKGKEKKNPLNPLHNTLRPLVIKALEPLHPLEAKRWYANTTEGKAVDALIDWLGEKKLMRFAEIWPVAVKEAFAPQAYKPSAILAKWPQIEKFLVERKKNGGGRPVGGEAVMGSIAEMIS